jgi:hypothetical protein
VSVLSVTALVTAIIDKATLELQYFITEFPPTGAAMTLSLEEHTIVDYAGYIKAVLEDPQESCKWRYGSESQYLDKASIKYVITLALKIMGHYNNVVAAVLELTIADDALVQRVRDRM